MDPKLILIWGSAPGAGRKTISRALAAQWTEAGRHVLYVDIDLAHPALPDTANLKIWVTRFKTLSPALLRNYFQNPAHACPRLVLKDLPDETTIQALIPLLLTAFEWIVWTSPVDGSAPSLAILDQAHLLLWIDRDQGMLAPHLARLTAAHYPSAISQVVYNAVPEIPEKACLAQIPHDPTLSLSFRQGIQQLMHSLQTRQELYLPRGATSGTGPSAETWVEDLKDRITAGAPSVELAQEALNTCLAEDNRLPASREQRTAIYSRVLDDVLGLGPLEPLLQDANVSEVMVNGAGNIFVEKKGKLYPTDIHFSSDTQLRTIIDRIVAPIGRRVDESSPLCDARLADGSRVNIVLPPLALDGPTLTIRKFMARALTLGELVEWQSLSSEMAAFLRDCILQRRNMIVAGGTGSGKTTLLNALSGVIPDDERIVTIEDAAELRLQKPHVVRLESRPPNAEGEGAVPIRRLVINALRMRPDRIIVGECRGGEALDMLQAMNTGHDGSLTTLHANSCRDALRRLETLVLMAGLDLPVQVVREQIQSAVDVVIQQTRLPDGRRKVVSITEITGMEGDTLTTQELFRLEQGAWVQTGLRSCLTRKGTA